MKKLILVLILGFFVLVSAGPVFSEIKGKVTKLDDKGNVQEITYYDDDKEIAKKMVDSKGNVTATARIPDGPIKLYDQDGNLVSEYFVKNNVSNGISKDFYKNGSVEYLATYKNGQLDGLTKNFYENGNLKSETNYSNGKVHGIYKVYNEDGDLIEDDTFSNGIRTSSKIYEYYSPGKLKVSRTLILDKKGKVIGQKIH
jgi:antitoxin component YwqK of YwqJK toxin-antitoxin module